MKLNLFEILLYVTLLPNLEPRKYLSKVQEFCQTQIQVSTPAEIKIILKYCQMCT